MTASDLQAINERFGLAGLVAFAAGQGGLATAEVSNGIATGKMTLAGGHVTSFVPANQPDVFWMSPNSAHVVGKAMRGGIPVCWPWFAQHPTDPQVMPVHGFARTSLWQPSGARALPDGATEVRMRLTDSDATRRLWPHPFELEIAVAFGASLSITLAIRNTGKESFHYTGALHTYYQVSDVRQIRIRGLERTYYLDKTEGMARKLQTGSVEIKGWTDRIYLDTAAVCVIEDPGYRRSIRVAKEGSGTTVVWNPMEKVVGFPDVGAGNQLNFICVETANAGPDIVTVAPGDERRLVARISIE